MAAYVTFDANDIDDAIAELDARYLAGEAAVYSHSWSVAVQTYAASNMQQLRVTPDCVSIDHRHARAFAPGELSAYMHETWKLAPNVWGYVDAVHRLSDVGTVVSHVVSGWSREGFEAEWREVILVTIEGDLVNRCELFDEADLDAAIARFEQLSPRHSGYKTGQRSSSSMSGRTSRLATGTPWPKRWPTTTSASIIDGSSVPSLNTVEAT